MSPKQLLFNADSKKIFYGFFTCSEHAFVLLERGAKLRAKTLIEIVSVSTYARELAPDKTPTLTRSTHLNVDVYFLVYAMQRQQN